MGLPFQTFIDSLQQRGFAVDSAKTDSAFQMVVMGSDAVRYRLVIAQKDGQVAALQENWNLQSNDSTRQLWQQMRDDFEKDAVPGPTCRSTATTTRSPSSRPTAVSSLSPSKILTNRHLLSVTIRNSGYIIFRLCVN